MSGQSKMGCHTKDDYDFVSGVREIHGACKKRRRERKSEVNDREEYNEIEENSIIIVTRIKDNEYCFLR
jgi:hypothetical protein